MQLHKQERDWYVLEITVTPPLEGPREASFDGGSTWKPATAVGSDWAWLVAGPGFVPPDGDSEVYVTIPESVVPLLRVVNEPVHDIGYAPEGILIWS